MLKIKITDAEFNKLVEFMHREYGINLSQKRILIEGRLNMELQKRGCKTYSDYLETVYKDRTGTEIVYLLNKLTTNHTYFMREPEHYDFMVKEFLPYITSLKRPRKYINMWSAGCSSGEEPYTNQMQMLEFLGAQAPLWDTTIYASDISDKVLTKAKEGIYHESSMKALPATWKRKYFTDVGNECFQVKPEIRRKVNFRAFNLMKPIPKPAVPYDIIFCRNVMIYFDNPTKIDLVRRFYDVLAPGGYLFIGHAESIPRETTNYEYVKPAIYRKPL